MDTKDEVMKTTKDLFYGAAALLTLTLWVTLTLMAVSCTSINRGGAAADAGATGVSVERLLPHIKTAATLAIGAGLRFGVDAAHREKVANLSWSVSQAAWTLTDGSIPTADELARYLLAFDYELDVSARTDYALIVNSIAGLYAGYYAQIQGNPELAVKVLGAIAEGTAAGSAAYAGQFSN
jgi:hypothetical protein